MNLERRPLGRYNNLPSQKRLRRHLRNVATTAERALWQPLRNRQVVGRRFRRQHGIGGYIVDFYCPEERLVIELDGEVHDHPLQRRRDRQRREYLDSLDLRVLRFRNEDVLADPADVLKRIATSITESPNNLI
jgi:very-short-patch-repair endonuclease